MSDELNSENIDTSFCLYEGNHLRGLWLKLVRIPPFLGDVHACFSSVKLQPAADQWGISVAVGAEIGTGVDDVFDGFAFD